MSGHSKWANIKNKKGKTDALRGKITTKISREITIAVRMGGPEVTGNMKLKLALAKAKANNVPKDNIQRAIQKGAGAQDGSNFEEITYEGYGPGGIGLIIETATDNRNRTFPEVRTALIKNGGRIADAGSVMFQFTRKGVIVVNTTGEDALLEILDAGAEDAIEEDGMITVYTDQKDLMKVRASLLEAGLKIEEAELQYVPNTEIEIVDEEISAKIEKVMDALDDLDDVVNVHTNAK